MINGERRARSPAFSPNSPGIPGPFSARPEESPRLLRKRRTSRRQVDPEGSGWGAPEDRDFSTSCRGIRHPPGWRPRVPPLRPGGRGGSASRSFAHHRPIPATRAAANPSPRPCSRPCSDEQTDTPPRVDGFFPPPPGGEAPGGINDRTRRSPAQARAVSRPDSEIVELREDARPYHGRVSRPPNGPGRPVRETRSLATARDRDGERLILGIH